MNKEDLIKANKIKEEVHELDNFIRMADKVWTGKLTIKDKIMRFVSSDYGWIKSEEYKMDTEMKNRVLDVLRDRKKELEKEFEEM